MAKEKDYLNNKQLWLKGREVAGGGGFTTPSTPPLDLPMLTVRNVSYLTSSLLFESFHASNYVYPFYRLNL